MDKLKDTSPGGALLHCHDVADFYAAVDTGAPLGAGDLSTGIVLTLSPANLDTRHAPCVRHIDPPSVSRKLRRRGEDNRCRLGKRPERRGEFVQNGPDSRCVLALAVSHGIKLRQYVVATLGLVEDRDEEGLI